MRIAAVDLGASSGRVMVADVGPGTLDLVEVARFPNRPVTIRGTLHWDVLALYRGILDGLRDAGPLDSIGVDGWAVDYGLLDGDGRLIGNPVHYRDDRTAGVVVPEAMMWRATGIAAQPFNTANQLLADPRAGDAAQLLLIPDLIGYWLTGERGAEVTNASTTRLLSAGGGRGWATELVTALGLRPELLPELRYPGDPAGTTGPDTGLPPTRVTVVGSHDTASAVAGVPATDRFAYISCGTWSLAGVELPAPVLTPEAHAAGFTNELGIDGTIRFLRNVMGLWLLQECLADWRDATLAELLPAAARRPALRAVVDAADPAFLAPGGMPDRIRAACAATGQPVPEAPADVVRCVVDSLALAHRRAVDDAERLSGADVDVIHLVGGGSRNELLCQLTADACGRPVVAGPTEAGALGNVLVQARALGAVEDDLAATRRLIRDTQAVTAYRPQGGAEAWEAADARLAA